MMHEWKS
jgi:gas vesicle protein